MIERAKSLPAHQLRLQTLWTFIGCSLVMLLIILSLARNPSTFLVFRGSDKASHFFAYAVTMLWFSLVFAKSWVRCVVALGLIVVGVSLEYLQGMSGYRTFEYGDMVANSAGIFCALLASKTPLSRSLAIFEGYLLQLAKR